MIEENGKLDKASDRNDFCPKTLPNHQFTKFSEASVSLAMTDAQNGVLTLNNAVRGLNKVAVNVSVAEQSDGSFSFQGTNSIATTKAVADLVSSIDVNVAGTITLDGKATVEVTSAANGFLVKKWNLCDKTLYCIPTQNWYMVEVKSVGLHRIWEDGVVKPTPPRLLSRLVLWPCRLL